MRVLHVDSAGGWRGGQNQVLLTARGMRDRGHEVLLACQAGGVLESRARDVGLTVAPAFFHGDLSPAAVWSMRRAWSAFHPEVVQLHDPHALSAGTLVSLVRAREPSPQLLATRRVDFPLRGPLSRLKFRSCKRVIAVSRAIARVLEADGLEPDRVRVVYEGVPDRPPAAGGAAALQALGISPESPVVGNVAALTGHKDHSTLLEAAARVIARVPEVRFLIVGDGELRRSLEGRAKALGLGAHCVFAGFRKDLDVLIPAFTLFCLSSRMEGLGTSLLDAMAFGRPVVATRAGGIPEAVEDGLTGLLVPARNPLALAEALLRLLSDASQREQMGRAARRRFEERFTAERMVDETLAVYRDALESRSSRSPGT